MNNPLPVAVPANAVGDAVLPVDLAVAVVGTDAANAVQAVAPINAAFSDSTDDTDTTGNIGNIGNSQPIAASAPGKRKRPPPGERRVQILQTLAQMLEQPGAERVTTAALAGRLDVSEAALYRHFASKAQMFEGLLDFIDSSVFTLVNQIIDREPSPSMQAQKVAAALLQFAEKNPGMARVMVGDALVFEHERLSARMNQFFDKVESQLRQSLRAAAEAAGSPTPTVDAQALASAITALIVGRLQRYARSGFKRLPTEHIETALQRLTT